jgi:hypothetical protein
MKMAMPGNYIRSVKIINDMNEFFGFIEIKIQIPKDCKYPFAPYRDLKANLITPTGDWIGLYPDKRFYQVIK